MQENDPDTLQFLDECNVNWTTLWVKATNKRPTEDKITLFIPQKALQPNSSVHKHNL